MDQLTNAAGRAVARGIIARRIYYDMRQAEYERRRREEAKRREEEQRRAREAEEKRRQESSGSGTMRRMQNDGTLRSEAEAVPAEADSVLFEVNRLPDIVLETDAMETITETGLDADKVLYASSLNKYLQPTKPAAQYDSPRVASLRRRVVEKLQLNKQHTPMHRKEGIEYDTFFPRHSSELKC